MYSEESTNNWLRLRFLCNVQVQSKHWLWDIFIGYNFLFFFILVYVLVCVGILDMIFESGE